MIPVRLLCHVNTFLFFLVEPRSLADIMKCLKSHQLKATDNVLTLPGIPLNQANSLRFLGKKKHTPKREANTHTKKKWGEIDTYPYEEALEKKHTK